MWSICSSRYRFSVNLPGEAFFTWENDQTLEILIASEKRKVPKKKRWEWVYRQKYVPVPYARLVHQLVAEIEHSTFNRAHEAQRRASYASRVLEQFGDEIESIRGLDSHSEEAYHFRSHVLSPILQRQRQGVPDDYVPSIHAGIVRAVLSRKEEIKELEYTLTMNDVTSFYLEQDPVDAIHIPAYVRHAVSIREVRWHLNIVRDPDLIKDVKLYESILGSQDELILSNERWTVCNPGRVPPFTETEARIIATDGLWPVFEGLLEDYVFAIPCFIHAALTFHLIGLPGSRR